jgi:hypothetical protein
LPANTTDHSRSSEEAERIAQALDQERARHAFQIAVQQPARQHGEAHGQARRQCGEAQREQATTQFLLAFQADRFVQHRHSRRALLLDLPLFLARKRKAVARVGLVRILHVGARMPGRLWHGGTPHRASPAA